jgi:glycerophosphoryl diester phosphodiesterase
MNAQGKKSRPMTIRAGRVVVLTFGILLAGLVFADQPQIPANWTVRDHLPVEQFIIQAHRGAGEMAEENSISAFELGWKLNCIPESDLRTTKDGVIVAFHDNTFARVVKDVSPELAKKGVKDLTLAELMKLDVGSFRGEQFTGRRVARMSEVFALMRGKPERRLYMDIKNVDLKQLAGEVKSAAVERQVILASTKYDVIRNWKKIVPESQTLLWMGGTQEYLTGRFEELRKANFADVTQVQVHTHLPGGVTTIARDAKNPFKEPDAFLRARGDELRQHNILYQTLPYGGSTREVYLKLLDLGFMSFATDHPDVTWAAVREFYGVK